MTTEVLNPPHIDFNRKYTLEEFLNLDFPDDDCEYELIRGEIVPRKKGGVSAKHGEIVGRLSQHFNIYLDANPSFGRAYAQASCSLGQTDPAASWVEPDVSLVKAGRTPAKFKGAIPVAPDLIVEVNSPSDSDEKIQQKIELYQATGVGEVWSVYMLSQYVVVYRFGENRRIFLDLPDELDGGIILPGFRLSVQKLFE